MRKPSTVCAVLLGILVTIAIFAVASWITYEQGPSDFSLGGSPPATLHAPAAAKKNAADTQLTFICGDATHSLPVNGFDAPPKVYTETLLGGLDFDKKTGWYLGQFALSETRKGALTQEGSKVKVSRPALFERYGVMVTGEQFTLDRATGEFLQSITLNDGRQFDLIKGYCGKLTKAPF